MTPQVKAFLDLIAFSEIGPAMLAMPETDNGYRVCVGSTPHKLILVSSYSQHPRLRDKATNSDAAGRYQFMGRYWEHYRDQLGLPDFGPDSQDKWAVQLIRECHAIEAIENGRIEEAIALCSSRWASFPGNSYKQPQKSTAELCAAYVKAGGVIA